MLTLSACATAPKDDALAGYNHAMFNANTAADTAIIEPVARGYRSTVPKPARDRLRNFLANLRAPTDLLNNVLQGQGQGALNTLARFGVNSTMGIGGLFDPATSMGIEAKPEDFGQTLAVWGTGPGPYLVLPFFGPNNFRDTTGLVVDIVTHPVNFLRYDYDTVAQYSRVTATGLDQRTGALDIIKNVRETSLDEYASLRSLYEQSRNNAIRNGELAIEDIPDFDEFDDDE